MTLKGRWNRGGAGGVRAPPPSKILAAHTQDSGLGVPPEIGIPLLLKNSQNIKEIFFIFSLILRARSFVKNPTNFVYPKNNM